MNLKKITPGTYILSTDDSFQVLEGGVYKISKITTSDLPVGYSQASEMFDNIDATQQVYIFAIAPVMFGLLKQVADLLSYEKITGKISRQEADEILIETQKLIHAGRP